MQQRSQGNKAIQFSEDINANKSQYIAKKQRRVLWLLSFLVIILGIIGTQLGAVSIHLTDIWHGIQIDWLKLNSTTIDTSLSNTTISVTRAENVSSNARWQIWLNIRLPRILLALLIGLALAISGAVLQGLFRNPLADPGLLGISSGAALMVALTILCLPLFAQIELTQTWFSARIIQVIQQYIIVISAFFGGLLVSLILFFFARHKHSNLIKLLLLGVAINAISGGAIGLFSYLSNDSQLRQFILWTMGTLGTANWHAVMVSASVIVPISFLLLRYAQKINVLQLGFEQAFYLGIDVKRVQWQLLILCAILVGTAVAFTGVIGFVGLVIPHLLRMQFGTDHHFLLPGSIFAGALFLLLADTIARTLILPAEMPVGIITSLVGGPYFLWLILKLKT